jgi:hypothetical protein
MARVWLGSAWYAPRAGYFHATEDRMLPDGSTEHTWVEVPDDLAVARFLPPRSENLDTGVKVDWRGTITDKLGNVLNPDGSLFSAPVLAEAAKPLPLAAYRPDLPPEAFDTVMPVAAVQTGDHQSVVRRRKPAEAA